MCWKCDHPDADEEDYLDELRRTIRTHGWAVQCVEDDRRPFAYTIGLHDYAMPELLVTGLAPHESGRLLNWAAAHSVEGLHLSAGQQFTDPGGRAVEVVDVECPEVHLTFALALEGPRVCAQQLVWGGQSRQVAMAGRVGSRSQAATGPGRAQPGGVAQNA